MQAPGVFGRRKSQPLGLPVWGREVLQSAQGGACQNACLAIARKPEPRSSTASRWSMPPKRKHAQNGKIAPASIEQAELASKIKIQGGKKTQGYSVFARLVPHRTALVCQMRDRGLIIGASITRARGAFPEILTESDTGLSAISRQIITPLFEHLGQGDQRMGIFDRRIDAVFRTHPSCQGLARICGIGPKTAAVVASRGDGRDFKSGRHLAAWMGLMRCQHPRRLPTAYVGAPQTRQASVHFAGAWRGRSCGLRPVGMIPFAAGSGQGPA